MLSSDLREKAVQYIEAEITLEELETWYGERVPDFLLDPDSEDADFVAALELALAEYYDDYRTEEEVKNFIRDLLSEHETITVNSQAGAETFVTSSASTTKLSNDADRSLTPSFQW